MNWKQFFQTLLTTAISGAITGLASSMGGGASVKAASIGGAAGGVMSAINHWRTPPGGVTVPQ